MFYRKYLKKKFAYYLSSLFFDMAINDLIAMPSIISFIWTVIHLIKKPFYDFYFENSKIYFKKKNIKQF